MSALTWHLKTKKACHECTSNMTRKQKRHEYIDIQTPKGTIAASICIHTNRHWQLYYD